MERRDIHQNDTLQCDIQHNAVARLFVYSNVYAILLNVIC